MKLGETSGPKRRFKIVHFFRCWPLLGLFGSGGLIGIRVIAFIAQSGLYRLDGLDWTEDRRSINPKLRTKSDCIHIVILFCSCYCHWMLLLLLPLLMMIDGCARVTSEPNKADLVVDT